MAILIMTSEEFVVDGILNFKKKIVSRSKLVSRDLYSPTQQSVSPNNVKLQINFFLNAKQRLVPYGISIRRNLYFNYYKDY